MTAAAPSPPTTPAASSGARATATPRGRARRVTLAVIGLTGFAAVVRFVALGREGFWHDELIMAAAANRGWADLVASIRAGRPALYPLASWGWSRVFGTSEFAIRALPAWCGTLSVPALYLAARQLVGVRPALVAAALMAGSGFHLAYGQEHRYYALSLLCAVLAIACLLHAMRRGGWRWWGGYVACGALAAYAHDPTVIAIACVVAGGVVGFAGRWRAWWRPLLLAHAALACLAVPRALQYLGAKADRDPDVEMSAAELTGWIEPPPAWAPVRSLANFLMRGLRYVDETALAVAAVVLAVAVAWAVVRRGRAGWRALPSRLWAAAWRRRTAMAVLLAWLAGPMAVLLALSWAKQPIYLDRYLITASPAWFVLIGLTVLAARRVAAWPLVTLAVLAAMAGPVWTTWSQTDNAQWREAAAVIRGGWATGDAVAVMSDDGSVFTVRRLSESLVWYLPRAGRVAELHIDAPAEHAAATASAAAGPSGRLWVLVRDNPAADARPASTVAGWPGVEVVGLHRLHQVVVLQARVAGPAVAGPPIGHPAQPAQDTAPGSAATPGP